MQTRDVRVTARTVHGPDGQTYTEYRVGRAAFGSAEALQAALDER
jgi:hypothetical protein